MAKPTDILVTAAVHPEVSDLIERLGLEARPDVGGRPFFKGSWKHLRVGILITGPGMINAAQAHTAMLEKSLPAQIIHTGCGGIFPSSGGVIGDLAVATSETDIHTGIEQDGEVLPAPLPFSLMDTESGPVKGTYPLDPISAKAAKDRLATDLVDSETGLFSGPFITVSTITATDRRARVLYKALSPVMESMEGSAAAHVARLYKVPFLEIRAASNRVGRRDKTQWNLPLAFERCSTAVFHLIDHFTQWRLPHD